MNAPDPSASELEQRLEAGVRERYRQVASDPRGHFVYAIGRASAVQLGYASEWLERVPGEVLERFVGVGNPFAVRVPRPGERVLDVGCGAGADAFVAAHLVGAQGRVAGVDLTPELVALAREAAERAGVRNLAFELGPAARLPFDDASFDQVVSNGALNLVVDKERAFAELARVLRPTGTLAVADLLVESSVPDHVLADMDAWST